MLMTDYVFIGFFIVVVLILGSMILDSIRTLHRKKIGRINPITAVMFCLSVYTTYYLATTPGGHFSTALFGISTVYLLISMFEPRRYTPEEIKAFDLEKNK